MVSGLGANLANLAVMAIEHPSIAQSNQIDKETWISSLLSNGPSDDPKKNN